MKLLLILLFWLPIFVFGQHEKYSKIEIIYDKEHLSSLLSLGLPLDHAHFLKNKIQAELSQADLLLLKNNNYQYSILIDDAINNYQKGLNNNTKSNTSTSNFLTCDNSFNDTISVPNDFSLGTMGGFFTYDEMLSHLDKMADKYPNLITVKSEIDTFLTEESRPIYFVKISDNASIDESSSESQVLYDAVHHAREPMSMSQLIFYMYYLLENYDKNDQVKFVVDNLELFFVPCVNPDGYIYNEITNPLGGGLWRKNRRDNGDGTFGVDLNRNYGFDWADDDIGSSPNTNSDTYRGSSPFSEPETKAMKYLCEQNDFKITLNYHSFSNLLIMPDNYVDDSVRYIKFAETITENNQYRHGIGEVVGYNINGDSDIWMYGEQLTKNKQYVFTPEVGSVSDGFWPATNRIIPLAKENLIANLNTALLSCNYVSISEISNYYINNTHNLDIELQSFGIKVPSSANVKVTTTSSSIDFINNPSVINSFVDLDIQKLIVPIKIKDNVLEGEIIDFNIEIDFGDVKLNKKISKLYSNQKAIIKDDFEENLVSWKIDFWGVTDEYFKSSKFSMTDSPYSKYPSNLDNELAFFNYIDLSRSSIKEAFIKFSARWEIESGFDYLQVIVNNGTSDYPMCGNYTNLGIENTSQPFGEPLYDGVQDQWIDEHIDLTDFLGQSIKVKFEMVSDDGIEMDGFYLDDFEVFLVEERENLIETRLLSNSEIKVYPNPTHDKIMIKIDNAKNVKMNVLNTLGQLIYLDYRIQNGYIIANVSELEMGIYNISLAQNGEIVGHANFVKE